MQHVIRQFLLWGKMFLYILIIQIWRKIKCYVWIDCMVGNLMHRGGSLSYKNNGDSKFILLSPKNWNRSFWKHSKKNCLPHKNDFWRVRTHFWGFPKTMAMSQKTTESGPDNQNSFPCCDVGAKKRKQLPPSDDMTPQNHCRGCVHSCLSGQSMYVVSRIFCISVKSFWAVVQCCTVLAYT